MKGPIQVLTLISNSISFGPRPAAEEEVEQQLTITASGTVIIKRFCMGDVEQPNVCIEDCHRQLPEDVVEIMFDMIETHFNGDCIIQEATDVGQWTMRITDADGQIERFSGALLPNSIGDQGRLSRVIRFYLGRNDLFCFDGKKDGIDRISISLHHHSEMKVGCIINENDPRYSIRDSYERLIIERSTGDIGIRSTDSEGDSFSQTYSSKYLVGEFLDSIPLEGIIDASTPKDEEYMPMVCDGLTIGDNGDIRLEQICGAFFQKVIFNIDIITTNGLLYHTKTLFAPEYLPSGWYQFVTALREFIEENYHSELLPGWWEREEYCFCKVLPAHRNRALWYIAEVPVDVDDTVRIPLGKDNRAHIGTVTEVEWATAERAPFPVRKTKRLFGKIQ